MTKTLVELEELVGRAERLLRWADVIAPDAVLEFEPGSKSMGRQFTLSVSPESDVEGYSFRQAKLGFTKNDAYVGVLAICLVAAENKMFNVANDVD